MLWAVNDARGWVMSLGFLGSEVGTPGQQQHRCYGSNIAATAATPASAYEHFVC